MDALLKRQAKHVSKQGVRATNRAEGGTLFELFLPRCEAPVADRRRVRDSGGHAEERYVIAVPIALGHHRFDAEVTLTSRDTMLFRCLLGRTALRGRFLVDPGRSYLIGRAPGAGADPRQGGTST